MLEVDSVHAKIESKSKNHEIYVPQDWHNIIKKAKKSKENPYRVIEVNQDMIYNFKNIVNDAIWKTNTNNEIIPWSKIKEIHVNGDEPGILKYKVDFASEYLKLNTKLHETSYTLQKAAIG